MKQKIIFFDIDGTLVPDGDSGTVPESTKTAIKKARENGHLTFINTGRTYINVNPNIKALGFDGYLCGCGTYIYYRDNCLLKSTIPHAQCMEIIEMMRKCRIPGFYEENSFIFFDDELPAHPEIIKAKASYGRKVKDLPLSMDNPDFTFDKILAFIEPYSDGETFKAYINSFLEYIDRGGNMAEIIQKDYSKATAIQFMCDYLGLSLDDCYVIGDSTNDLSMLKYVRHSIAMGNSTPEIVPYCEYQTTDILDNGIYNALSHYGLI